jgi:transposase
MKAIQGGKAKHDTIDAQNIAVLLRGGMRPQASVYPAARRATRDLLRRRRHLAPNRGELRAHVPKTNRQSNLPAIGQDIAYQATRDGVAERVTAPAGHKRIAGDLSRLDYDEHLLRDWERSLLNAAQPHDAHTLSLLRTVPGIGKSLSLVRLYAIHDLDRFPRGQACASECRLGTWATESAGKRSGTSGTKIGKAHLTWAFADAAVLCLRDHPEGQQFLVR